MAMVLVLYSSEQPSFAHDNLHCTGHFSSGITGPTIRMVSPLGVRVHASPCVWCGSNGLVPLARQPDRSCRHIAPADAADARGGPAESLAALGRVSPDDGAFRLSAVGSLVFGQSIALARVTDVPSTAQKVVEYGDEYRKPSLLKDAP